MREIPIDKSIKEFDAYLDRVDNGMLSASFGGGKSYFLDKFKDKYSDKYCFLTLYPVNYQVTGNYDIFELIKRDLLIQMLCNGMIAPEYDIDDSIMYQFYIMDNPLGIFWDLFSSIRFINGFDKLYKITEEVKKIIEKWSKSYNDYKKKIKDAGDDKQSEIFLSLFDHGKDTIYEYDAITRIITKNIQAFRKKKKKKVVLIMEDLDRLDPSHLFRILNVFSAHIDRQYMGYKESEDSGNHIRKFDIDKTLLVCDNKKMKHLFHHFYGEQANYNGYINKFLSSECFYYSFEKDLKEYLIEELQKITGWRKGFFDSLFEMLNFSDGLNVRTLSNALDMYQRRIKDVKIVYFEGIEEPAKENPFIRFCALLAELQFDIEIINNTLCNMGSDAIKMIKAFAIFGITKQRNPCVFDMIDTSKNLISEVKIMIQKTDNNSILDNSNVDVRTKISRDDYYDNFDFEKMVNKAKEFII